MADRVTRAGRAARGLLATAFAAGVDGIAQAASFKPAPQPAEEGGTVQSQGPDTILGLVHINTAVFIAVGAIALYWFVFGGGRKAKFDRK